METLESLGAVLDASINEIFMFDATTLKFVQVNKGARRNLGYSMEELREMTPLSFKPRFTADKFEVLIAPLKSGEVEKIEFLTVHQRKDGSLYPVEVHLQLSQLGERQIFLAMILDITSRTETQAALDQAQRFLELAPDATIIVNSEGVIQYASAQTEQLLGYQTSQLLGKNVDELVPAGMRGGHAAHRGKFKARPKPRLMGDGEPLFALHKKGHEIPVEVSLNPIQTVDGLLISASLRDITERLKSEQVIREARDVAQEARDTAQKATEAKSRFLAAASHDLRQPLQSLGLYLSTLNILSQDPKALKIGGRMESALDSMKELMDTLLDVSKLESGSIEPKKYAFSAQSILNDILTDCGPIAEDKGLTLICEPTEINIYSDIALLKRILENFVSNAIRYTDKGTITLLCEIDGGHLTFSVKDTGVGIPEDALEIVFEEYYQLGNAHREQGKGLGLGLSVVKHIASLLEHDLDVQSTVGKGSTFSVRVPISNETEILESPNAKTNAKPADAELPTILCIDDNEAVLDSLTLLLDTMGYDIFLAGDGTEALAHINSGLKPDIVLSDYRLPGDNGIEVIQKLRANLPTNLPAIMMTGDTSGAKIRQSGLEQLEVLSKPVDVKQLISFIETMTMP